MKGALYSLKLKLEFWILNKLTNISSQAQRSSQMEFSVDGSFPYTNPADASRSKRRTRDISPTHLASIPWDDLDEEPTEKLDEKGVQTEHFEPKAESSSRRESQIPPDLSTQTTTTFEPLKTA